MPMNNNFIFNNDSFFSPFGVGICFPNKINNTTDAWCCQVDSYRRQKTTSEKHTHTFPIWMNYLVQNYNLASIRRITFEFIVINNYCLGVIAWDLFWRRILFENTEYWKVQSFSRRSLERLTPGNIRGSDHHQFVRIFNFIWLFLNINVDQLIFHYRRNEWIFKHFDIIWISKLFSRKKIKLEIKMT